MTDEINRWKVGNVKITRVVEMEGGFPPGAMFNGLTEDRVKAIDWIHPHYALPDGTVRYSVHAYIVESQGHRIIVDTCIGNDKPRNNEGWNKLQIPFLDRLKKAGYTPESIDTVLCTHLHLDHVGWNTRWDGKKLGADVPQCALSLRPGRVGALDPRESRIRGYAGFRGPTLGAGKRHERFRAADRQGGPAGARRK